MKFYLLKLTLIRKYILNLIPSSLLISLGKLFRVYSKFKFSLHLLYVVFQHFLRLVSDLSSHNSQFSQLPLFPILLMGMFVFSSCLPFVYTSVSILYVTTTYFHFHLRSIDYSSIFSIV